MNVYEAGSWLPPHVDSEAFDRPFCTLSLLSQQEAIFGETIDGEAGAWRGPVRVVMPPGSVLRVDGVAAGPTWKHALPAATDRRISLTFRKLGAARRAAFDEIRLASAEAAEARRERRLRAKEARGWRPAPNAPVSNAVDVTDAAHVPPRDSPSIRAEAEKGQPACPSYTRYTDERREVADGVLKSVTVGVAAERCRSVE